MSMAVTYKKEERGRGEKEAGEREKKKKKNRGKKHLKRPMANDINKMVEKEASGPHSPTEITGDINLICRSNGLCESC